MTHTLHTEKQVAKILEVSLSKLRQDRHLGRGLAYIRVGRSIRYTTEDIEKFLEENRIQPSN